MKKIVNVCVLGALCVGLQGCFTYVEGGPYGGAAWNATVAQEHCAKYGKYATVTAIDPDKGFGNNRYAFNCLIAPR
jgi:hypothetical protein